MKKLLIILFISSTSHADIKWLNPSKVSCDENGGKIAKGESICMSEWAKAKDICKAIGGRLPTLDELKDVITKCGGTLDAREENSKNISFKTCCKESGFSTQYFYWSSDRFIKASVAAWNVNFEQGYASIANKYYSVYVRCVDSSNTTK